MFTLVMIKKNALNDYVHLGDDTANTLNAMP